MQAGDYGKSTFELVIQFADAIAWPLTLLIILLIFKKNFADIIQRLGTIKADNSGFELSFQNKIEATKELFQKIKPKVISKSGQSIQTYTEKDNSPFHKILAVRSKLINYLKIISEKEGLAIADLSPDKILDKLKETGGMGLHQTKMVYALLNLTAEADITATEQQAKDIDQLLNQILIE